MKEKTFGDFRAVITTDGGSCIIPPPRLPDIMKPHQVEAMMDDAKNCLTWLRDEARRNADEKTPELPFTQ